MSNVNGVKEVKIQREDFPTLDEKPLFGLPLNAMYQIYLFYKKFPQDSIYVLTDVSSSDNDVILSSNAGEYNTFGIYFNNSIISNTKQYLLILQGEDLVSAEALLEKINNQKEQYGCSTFYRVVIEKDYNNFSERDYDNKLICQLLPDVPILNPGFNVIKQGKIYTPRSIKGADFVDVLPLFERFSFNNSSINLNISNTYKVIDEIKKMAKNNTIFFLRGTKDSDLNQEYNLIFCKIAAYLALTEQLKFDVNPLYNVYYMDDVRSLLGKSNSFASDYYSRIKNPIKVGMTIRNDEAYLCFRENDVNESTLFMLEAEFYEDVLTFNEESLNKVSLSINEIDIMKLEDKFGINSKDWETAKNAIIQIDKLCLEFEKSIKDQLGLSLTVPVCFNNLLLYRRDGKVKLGYVFKESIDLVYSVKPLDKRYKPFYISHFQIESVVDLAIAADGFKYKQILAKQGFKLEDMRYEFPDYARGIVTKALYHQGIVIGEESEATISEIGVWSIITGQLRNQKANIVLRFIDSQRAWTNGLLSYFGGPHPAVRRQINIEPRDWR